MKFKIIIRQMAPDAFLASCFIPGFSNTVSEFGRTAYEAKFKLEETVRYALTDASVIVDTISIKEIKSKKIKYTGPKVSEIKPVPMPEVATKPKGGGRGKKK